MIGIVHNPLTGSVEMDECVTSVESKVVFAVSTKNVGAVVRPLTWNLVLVACNGVVFFLGPVGKGISGNTWVSDGIMKFSPGRSSDSEMDCLIGVENSWNELMLVIDFFEF
jgi:hypothetical protein